VCNCPPSLAGGACSDTGRVKGFCTCSTLFCLRPSYSGFSNPSKDPVCCVTLAEDEVIGYWLNLCSHVRQRRVRSIFILQTWKWTRMLPTSKAICAGSALSYFYQAYSPRYILAALLPDSTQNRVKFLLTSILLIMNWQEWSLPCWKVCHVLITWLWQAWFVFSSSLFNVLLLRFFWETLSECLLCRDINIFLLLWVLEIPYCAGILTVSWYVGYHVN